MDIYEAFEVIHQSFDPESGSPEMQAMQLICQLQVFVSSTESKKEFEKYLEGRSLPLCGLELIKMRCYGIDIPEELRNENILKLSAEIDALADKINSTMSKPS